MGFRIAKAGCASLGWVLCALLVSCSDAPEESAYQHPEPITSCEPVGNTEPICGFENPEDLAPLPGDLALLVSEYGNLGESEPGAIALLRIASREREVLYRGGADDGESELGWGSRDCPGPPGQAFSPHGIDLVRRDDGRLQLLAVQHGGRESIEVFEVTGEAESWQVVWRGCVLAPEDANLNEVVGLSNGTFFTTKMVSLADVGDWEGSPPASDTGHVYGWSPASGYWVVPGTSGMLPNGIEISPDGRVLFMNASFGNELRKVDVETGELLGRAEVALPDNVTWAPD
jgi:hypothetical protein